MWRILPFSHPWVQRWCSCCFLHRWWWGRAGSGQVAARPCSGSSRGSAAAVQCCSPLRAVWGSPCSASEEHTFTHITAKPVSFVLHLSTQELHWPSGRTARKCLWLIFVAFTLLYWSYTSKSYPKTNQKTYNIIMLHTEPCKFGHACVKTFSGFFFFFRMLIFKLHRIHLALTLNSSLIGLVLVWGSSRFMS